MRKRAPRTGLPAPSSPEPVWWPALTSLVILPAVAAASLGWIAIGDVDEPGGYQRILAVPSGPVVTAAAAAIGAAALATWVGVLARTRRSAWHGRTAWGLLATGVVAGLAVAGGLRVVGARTYGANIGGGMVVLAAPLVAITLLVAVRRLLHRLAAREPQRAAAGSRSR